MRIKFFVVLSLVFFICGCAAWQLVKTPTKWASSELGAILPEGWMRLNYSPDLLFLTKDGEMLQRIRIYRYALNKDKELPITKKEFSEDMLPQDIAELIVNEASVDQNKQNFQLADNVPVGINGKEGFKITYAYNTVEKLKVKSVLYGFRYKKFIYLIQYEAAAQYYFDKDINVFNQFVSDVTVK
ncbi:MAG: hypothetical protein V1650_04255 [Candidatus Omnitrophota bacterium]